MCAKFNVSIVNSLNISNLTSKKNGSGERPINGQRQEGPMPTKAQNICS
jgi:hypothetical protein